MADIQQGIIGALKEYGIDARMGDEHTGVWVQEKKIASIGVAVKRWISFHGAAINLNVNLVEFRKFNPCGLSPEVMTSADQLLKEAVDMRRFTRSLLAQYTLIFDTVFTPVDLESLDEDLKSQEGGFTI
jgi:lipoate-protein ligase B